MSFFSDSSRRCSDGDVCMNNKKHHPALDTPIPHKPVIRRRRSIHVDDVNLLKGVDSSDTNTERRKHLLENAAKLHTSLSENNMKKPRRASLSHFAPIKAIGSTAERLSDSVTVARKLLDEIDKQIKMEKIMAKLKHGPGGDPDGPTNFTAIPRRGRRRSDTALSSIGFQNTDLANAILRLNCTEGLAEDSDSDSSTSQKSFHDDADCPRPVLSGSQRISSPSLSRVRLAPLCPSPELHHPPRIILPSVQIIPPQSPRYQTGGHEDYLKDTKTDKCSSDDTIKESQISSCNASEDENNNEKAQYIPKTSKVRPQHTATMTGVSQKDMVNNDCYLSSNQKYIRHNPPSSLSQDNRGSQNQHRSPTRHQQRSASRNENNSPSRNQHTSPSRNQQKCAAQIQKKGLGNSQQNSSQQSSPTSQHTPERAPNTRSHHDNSNLLLVPDTVARVFRQTSPTRSHPGSPLLRHNSSPETVVTADFGSRRTDERIKLRNSHTLKLQKMLKSMEDQMPTHTLLELKQAREDYKCSKHDT